MFRIVKHGKKEKVEYVGISPRGFSLLYAAHKGKLTRDGDKFYRYGKPVPRRDIDEIRYTHLTPEGKLNPAGKLTLLRGKDTACLVWGFDDLWKSILEDYKREDNQLKMFYRAQMERVA